jgi:hypothetical protein
MIIWGTQMHDVDGQMIIWGTSGDDAMIIWGDGNLAGRAVTRGRAVTPAPIRRRALCARISSR